MASKRIKVNHVYFRHVKSCGCSYYGTPKYQGEMVLPDGTTILGKTATNSGSAWGFTDYESYRETERKEIDGTIWERKVDVPKRYAYCEYHYTASGNVIFDYVTDEIDEKEGKC